MNSKKQAQWTGRTVRPSVFCALVVLAALVAGCPQNERIKVSPEQMRAYLADKPVLLHNQFSRVLTEGERNSVMYLLQAGVGAMELGEWSLAERTLDDALLRIEAIFGTTERARQARSIWYKESRKEFKGEPYERVMAYYYRGLLYMRRGDFQNARACFKSGALQDSFAEDENKRCDFAMMYFLEGWASQCNGDRRLASDAYKEVKKLRKNFVAPAWDDNVLIVAETGNSPIKVGEGPGRSELKLRRGTGFIETRVRLSVGGSSVNAYPMEDVAWQAMTRGGRVVDKIIKGKVVYRDTSRAIGRGLIQGAGAAMSVAARTTNQKDRQNMQIAAGGMALAGLAAHIFSSQVQTAADTRYWNNLPDKVHVYTCKLVPGQQSVSATFMNNHGQAIRGLLKSASVCFAPGKGRGIAWLRSRSAVK